MALQKGQRLREAGQFEVAAVGQIKSAGDRLGGWHCPSPVFSAFGSMRKGAARADMLS
ncbi:hypothetical protein GH913_21855 [Xanthomonas citri pv. malvacearum]|nr:hypothetical protein GH913_21855 [Xanthomonas citri pv. malvacearum]